MQRSAMPAIKNSRSKHNKSTDPKLVALLKDAALDKKFSVLLNPLPSTEQRTWLKRNEPALALLYHPDDPLRQAMDRREGLG